MTLLTLIRLHLGLDAATDEFNDELLSFIAAALESLNMVGLEYNDRITATTDIDDLLLPAAYRDMVIVYVQDYVKSAFDPTASATIENARQGRMATNLFYVQIQNEIS